ncbi:MAG: hypothetical protein WCP28_15340 [Actinomycetes bacterium]
MRAGPSLLVAVVIAGTAVTGCSTQDASLPPTVSPTVAASPSEVGASAQGNKVSIAAGIGVTSITYSFSDNYSIASDQQSTWGGVIGCSTPTTLCQMTVTAGRHDSLPVWQWFTGNVNGYGCLSDNPCSSISTMNFAFTGTLTINGQPYPLTLGQYGSGTSNRWWYGGPGWVTATASDSFPVQTPDHKYTLTGASNSKDWTMQVFANS